jgi:oligopeptide/dipeptide ABC transporter ATP-binding protein
MNKLLEVSGLKVSYSTTRGTVFALRDASFYLRPGEVFALVGESGSGKSATCRAVMGIKECLASVDGTVRFQGKDLLLMGQAELRSLYSRSIALLPQSAASLNPRLSVSEHIEETLSAHPESPAPRGKAERRDWAVELLRRYGLADAERVARLKSRELSGGMIQRVLMAIALCCSPSLVVADEPTKGLDLLLRGDAIEALRAARQATGTALLLVTHDLEVAAALADRIGVIYAGVFLEGGPTLEVLRRPRHPYTESLLAALPGNGLRATPGFSPSALEDLASCPFAPRCPLGSSCGEALDFRGSFPIGEEHVCRCPRR